VSATAKIGPLGRGTKRIVPSGPQAPRLTLYPSVRIVTGPPLASTFFSLPPAKKAIVRLSGDQNAKAAPSVSGKGVTEPSRDRTHSWRLPSQRAVNASR
jgi:hypothetical protein